MNTENSRGDAANAMLPAWSAPVLSTFDISEITQLGKLGSLFDADTFDSNYAPD